MEAAACPYIVRYYSSWVEDSDPRFQEGELIEVLQHVASEPGQLKRSGLKKLSHPKRHGLSIVHLDIKPDNILLSRGEPGYFKIADLGLAAAAIGARCDDITEGDCRYLAKEVLQGDFADLPKADVFSLGLVLYELGTNPNGLPSNGPEWHSLRRSLEVARLPELSPKLLQLMQDLVQPRKELRPTCEAVLQKLQEDADFSHPDPVQVQALQDEARRCREEAMRNRQRADEYWQEILCLKKQELMCGKTGARPSRSIADVFGHVTGCCCSGPFAQRFFALPCLRMLQTDTHADRQGHSHSPRKKYCTLMRSESLQTVCCPVGVVGSSFDLESATPMIPV
ncbi:Wee1 [Symbiodinium necroappetens]|uniref:Wee1 protein n=1 Tax=Symbiodinium necroappetens TaxID=1628268 RepID=A0A812NX85_9DINO|nr:Wee1 [Symbiodinium necroappetens]